jgi:hypothetical protein
LNISLGRVHWATGMAAWVAELPFVSVVPRVAAQLSTAAAGGAIAPVALPALSAASFGAMAVIGHVHTPAPSPSPPSPLASSSAPAVTRAPVRTLVSTAATNPTAWPEGSAPTAVIVGSVPGPAVTGPVVSQVTDVPASVAPLETGISNAVGDLLSSSATGPVSSGGSVLEALTASPAVGSGTTTVEPATTAATETVARTGSSLSGLLGPTDPVSDPPATTTAL